MRESISRFRILVLVVGLCVVTSVPANAAMLLYEPFAYANGTTLTGQGGALGTTGTWTTYDSINANGWWVHLEGNIANIVVAAGDPPQRNTFDGTVANLQTSGGYAGLPNPTFIGADPNADFEIGRYQDAHIGLDPSVTASFQAGTTTWFSYVAVRGWDRNMETPNLQLCTDPTVTGTRAFSMQNDGNGIGAGGGPPRNNRQSILPRYYLGGATYNLNGSAPGWTSDAYTADANSSRPWVASDDDGFGAANIVVGKIEWDADTGGEDIITVVSFLETDVISLAAFDAQVALDPNLSSANWAANKPDLDQSLFDTLNIAGTKFLVDEIRLGTTFEDVTPVPEPATMGLLALGGVALFRRRRRA